MPGCSIRAFWILNQSNTVTFSRRFPTVERQWQAAWKRQQAQDGGGTNNFLFTALPSDSQLVQALADRKLREGSIQGHGIREANSLEGSDSWVDDPITRHILSLQMLRTEEGASPALLWPLILHVKVPFRIIILPYVEPQHLAAYEYLCWRTDCGSTAEWEKESHGHQGLSSMLLELPCITGSFLLAKTIGDVVTGDATEPEVLSGTAPSTGGLLDSITGGIGISSIAARAKPVTQPMAAAATAVATVAGNATSAIVGGSKGSIKIADKDALRNFISSSMPFGTPLDMAATNIASVRSNGFSALDVPPTDLKQPAWKPYLYKGKQKIMLTVSEVVTAALYDRDDVPDTVSLSGQVNCRAELEGLPDVFLPIICPSSTKFESFTFHPCSQAPEHALDKQTVLFSPPLGNFILTRYLAVPSSIRPPVQGFYQLSMVSEDEGAFLFKLRLMEGYKAPFIMESCTLSIPFPRRKVLTLDGNPSIGTVSTFESLVEWKIVVSGRGLSKSTEVTFPGTIKFGQMSDSRVSSKHDISIDNYTEEEFESEIEAVGDRNKSENIFYEKMTKGDVDLAAVDLEEPFCWDAYSYAKASFRLTGGSMSGISIDPKTVSVYPAAKVPCEVFSQVVSGDYIFWNSLGRYPHVATPKA